MSIGHFLHDLLHSVLVSVLLATLFFPLRLLHMLVFNGLRLFVFVCNMNRRLAVISSTAQMRRQLGKKKKKNINKIFICLGLLLMDYRFIVEMMIARDCHGLTVRTSS